jgi:isopentenyl-diphosphate delta-isomerase type 1
MPSDNQSELFVWVDENDQELGKITRQEAHSGSQKIHRAVTVIILNQDRSKLLFQQRSFTKDLYPGVWSCGVGGHVTYGDTYDITATRELQEELGIINTKINFLSKHLYHLGPEREIMPIYEALITEQSTLKLDPSEVVGIEWCKCGELKNFISTHTVGNDSIEILTQTGYLETSKSNSE